MAFSERIWGLYAKKETTYATDAAPGATDAVKTMEPLWSRITPDYVWNGERLDDASGSLLPHESAPPRGRMAAVDIAWRLRGAGAAYSASVLPEGDPLFQASAMSQTIVTTGGSESVTYAPADTNHASATLWCYGANKLFKLVGCRGTWDWALAAGEMLICRFRMNGLMTADPTEIALATQTYDATVPPAAVGITLSVGGIWTPDAARASVAMGGSVQRLDSFNAADGIAEFEVSPFVPTMGLTGRTVALSTYDPYTEHKNATKRNITYTVGTAQYNRATMTLANTQLRRLPRHVVDNGFTAWDLEYLCPSVSLVFN